MPSINVVIPVTRKEFMSFVPEDYTGKPKLFMHYMTERLVELGKLQLELNGQDLVKLLEDNDNEFAMVNIWSEDGQKLLTVKAQLNEPLKRAGSLKGNTKPVLEFLKCPGKKKIVKVKPGKENSYSKPKVKEGFLTKFYKRIFP